MGHHEEQTELTYKNWKEWKYMDIAEDNWIDKSITSGFSATAVQIYQSEMEFSGMIQRL